MNFVFIRQPKREPKREPSGRFWPGLASVILDALGYACAKYLGVKEARVSRFRPSPPNLTAMAARA
jgi:hypothetical protein